jgi:tRNA (guanine6-N2)-methyltransferase
VKVTIMPLYAAEIIEGLEEIAQDELKRIKGVKILQKRAGEVIFHSDETRLRELKSIQSVYHLLYVPVPRPKALLGDQHFRQLVMAIDQAMSAYPAQTFRTLGIAAAGSESSVMTRLRDTLAKATQLAPADDKGDLLLRIRPSKAQDGWEVLVRLSPRPLATRAWRVRNYEAALNATVAHTLALLTKPRRDDVFLNLCAGSGSIAIERLMITEVERMLAIDNSRETLALSVANFGTAGVIHPSQHLLLADAKRLPIASGVATALAADLPFGQRSGSHRDNMRLYPALFGDAARVAVDGARFALITHEIRLMDQLIPTLDAWQLAQSFRITLRGLHPCIYVFVRR